MAELLARTARGRLDLVSVRPHRDGEGRRGRRASRQPAIEAYLDRMAWTLRQGGLTVDTSIRSGGIPEEIGRHATEISTRTSSSWPPTAARRVDRLLGRNIVNAVVRQTELPVLLIRPTDAWTSRATAFRKLLVCLDGSEGSEEVLPWARILARHFGSAILLLTVPEAESEVPRLEQYLESVAAALRDLGLAAESAGDGVGGGADHHRRGRVGGLRPDHDGDARA